MLSTADIIAIIAIAVTIVTLVVKYYRNTTVNITKIIHTLEKELNLIKADINYIKEDVSILKVNYNDNSDILDVRKTIDKLADKMNNLDKMVDSIAIKLELLTNGISGINIRNKTTRKI